MKPVIFTGSHRLSTFTKASAFFNMSSLSATTRHIASPTNLVILPFSESLHPNPAVNVRLYCSVRPQLYKLQTTSIAKLLKSIKYLLDHLSADTCSILIHLHIITVLTLSAAFLMSPWKHLNSWHWTFISLLFLPYQSCFSPSFILVQL